MSKPKKLYMKTPDARNPHGLTCESILRRLEVDGIEGKAISIVRWSDYASQKELRGILAARLSSIREITSGSAHDPPVFYSVDGYVLMAPYYYKLTRVLFKGCANSWENENANSTMTMRIYSWEKLIEDYNKNKQQLSVRFRTQAHNNIDPADFSDRLWDLNRLYVAYNAGYNDNANRQLELCGYDWEAT